MLENKLWLEVDGKAILHNISLIKDKVKKAKIMAVLHSNAYGHGGVEVAKIIFDEVDSFGVSFPDEGILLRKNGITKPILLLSPYFNEEAVIHHGLTPTADKIKDLEELVFLAKRHNRRLSFQLLLNTGMNRFGVNKEDYTSIISYIQENLKYLHLEGVYSEFAATVQTNAYFVGKQNIEFEKSLHNFTEKFDNLKNFHISDSDVAMHFGSSHFNMVRIGGGLFGQLEDAEKLGFQKTFKLKAKVLDIRLIKKGENAYLGKDFPIEGHKNRKVGILAIGTFDGFSPTKEKKIVWGKGKSPITKDGSPLKLIGHVSSQFTFIDLTSNEDIQVGDVVEIDMPSSLVRESIPRFYI